MVVPVVVADTCAAGAVVSTESDASNPAHNYEADGTYTVTLIATNALVNGIGAGSVGHNELHGEST